MQMGRITVAAFSLALGIFISAAPSNAALKFVIGSRNLLTLPIFLAKEKGLFKKYGVDMELLQVRGGSATTKALVANQADMMYQGVIATMKAMQAGAKIKFVMGAAIRNDYFLVAHKSIKSPKELEGRRVAISRLGAISYIMPRIIIMKSGADPDKVKWVPIGTSGPRQKALVAGKVDAGIMHIGSALKATTRPFLHVIGTVAKAMPEYPFGYISIRSDLIQSNRKEVVGAVAAFIEAYRIAGRDKAAMIAVAKKHMSLEKDFLSKGYDYLVEIGAYTSDGHIKKETYNLVLGIAREYKQIKKDLPANQFLDMSVQQEALRLIDKK